MAAGERAATIEAQAGTLEVEHQRAASILRTAQAYWELRAAQESLAILERLVSRQGDLLKSTTSLVNGGELAASNWPAPRPAKPGPVARPRARQRLYDARVELAAALGVASSGVDATLPTAAKDPFPVAPTPPPPAVDRRDGRRGPAPRPRGGDAREEAAAILQRNAVNRAALAPRPVGIAVLHGARRSRRRRHRGSGRQRRPSTPRRLRRGARPLVGPSFTLTLNYEKPLGNNSAKAAGRRAGERRTRAIETADLRGRCA